MQAVQNFTVRVGGIFGNHADYIHTEAIHAFFTPPGHHVEDFFADSLIFPVQIRLLFGEAVEIVHSRLLVILPGGTAEAAAPVVGLFAVFGIFPDIVVPVKIIFGFAALHKPAVFIGGVVYHQVHYQLQTSFVHLGNHPVKILHGSELRHDILIIGDIIPVVIVGGFVNGGQPDYIRAQFLNIVQMLCDSVEIADAVSVAVRKTSGINLINYAAFPPRIAHRFIPPVIAFCRTFPTAFLSGGGQAFHPFRLLRLIYQYKKILFSLLAICYSKIILYSFSGTITEEKQEIT